METQRIRGDSLFGIPLTTYREHDGESLFQYEMLLSTIAIIFFRTTLHQRSEPLFLRIFFALVLAFLTFSNQPYALIASVEVFSYAAPFWIYHGSILGKKDSKFTRIALVALSGLFSFVLCHMTANGTTMRVLRIATPSVVHDALAWLFPIVEVQEAYAIMNRYISIPGLLRKLCARLMFVTFHIQVGIGYLGIGFLNEEQHRRNQLVRMDMVGSDDKDKEQTSGGSSMNGSSKGKASQSVKEARAKKFQRSAAPFIFFTAVPYMIQIIFYGNINAFAYACFRNELHRSVRLHDLFEHENNLVAMAIHSPRSPGAYSDYMSTVVSTTYDIFNKKFFSLPKVMLLPMMMAKQPKMVVQIFPVIFLTDWAKGKAVAFMTTRIESLEKEMQQLKAVRSKVEAFDIKNAELLQRAGPGANAFTRHRWEELTVSIQTKEAVKDLTSRTKNFFRFIHRNWVFVVLVDCALAHLISVGKIRAAEIFVFSRAIEDAVDMALMRSRAEAELARMMTQIENLNELADVWDSAEQRNLLPCNLARPSELQHVAEDPDAVSLISLRNLQYSRGTATVRIDHLDLKAGVYALTGANGSGKSTLFRVLMSCNTNERAIDLPPSITLHTPVRDLVEVDDIERENACESAEENSTDMIEDVDSTRELGGVHPRLSVTMPSSRVAEISQTFYWPLYSKPIDWIHQHMVSQTKSEKELQSMATTIAEHLFSLEFTQPLVSDNVEERGNETTVAPREEAIESIIQDLLEEKEDWFGDLSGGQKSKVELVRKVFLHDECPHVLLIDETMAPLDPSSKTLVMAKLKDFCSSSVIIVIYHTDVGQEHEGESGEAIECVPSSNFFDGNIHVENQMVHIRPVC